MRLRARRHRTEKSGVYCVKRKDGSRTYVATWTEEVPVSSVRPFSTMHRTIKKEASTFDEACRLQAEGQATERDRRRSVRPRLVEQLGDRFMAVKWFEYRGRQ